MNHYLFSYAPRNLQKINSMSLTVPLERTVIACTSWNFRNDPDWLACNSVFTSRELLQNLEQNIWGQSFFGWGRTPCRIRYLWTGNAVRPMPLPVLLKLTSFQTTLANVCFTQSGVKNVLVIVSYINVN